MGEGIHVLGRALYENSTLTSQFSCETKIAWKNRLWGFNNISSYWLILYALYSSFWVFELQWNTSLPWSSQVDLAVENPPANARDIMRHRFDIWVGTIPWRRKWQPTPVFLPRESHGQRSLVGYSPQGCKELDTTERLSMHAHPPLSYGSYLLKEIVVL